MKVTALTLTIASLLAAPALAQTPAAAPQSEVPQKITLLSSMLRMQQGAERDVLEAAELMPEEHYGFRATSESRPFGQTVAHIALSRLSGCADRAGKENPHKGEKVDASRTKAQLVGMLKTAATLCAAARDGLTEAALPELVKSGNGRFEVARGASLVSDIAHMYEVYGTMAVMLRLKGLVPPTTAREIKARGSHQ